MTYFFVILPIGAIAYLFLRLLINWHANKPQPGDGLPVSSEELSREKPAAVFADISYEHLDPLLERIENAIDWGFSPTQRSALILRVNSLFPGRMTYAIFPVQYDAEPTDILMHFGRINHDLVTCKFEGSPSLIRRINCFLEDIPRNAI